MTTHNAPGMNTLQKVAFQELHDYGRTVTLREMDGAYACIVVSHYGDVTGGRYGYIRPDGTVHMH